MNGNSHRICYSMALLFICLWFCLNRPLLAMPADANSITQASILETSPKTLIKRAVADRKLTDFDYSTNLTEDQVIAAWGLPDAYASTNNFFWVYYVEDNEVWMTFKTQSPHEFIGVLEMPPAAKGVPERRNRKLIDLAITNGITFEQVTAVWGRPDYFPPTDTMYCSYLLDQGREMWFEFDIHPPYRAIMTALFDKNGMKKQWLTTLDAPYRNIFGDIHWSTNVTEREVMAVWGHPDAYAGTNNFYWVYRVKDREAWIGFEPDSPYRLAAFRQMPPAAKEALKKPERKLSDLTITNGTTYEQVTAVWGRPDYFPQIGICYCSYRLEHGQEVWFEFDFRAPYRALGALLFDQKSEIKDLFSSTQEISTNFPIKRAATERNINDIYDPSFPTQVTENQIIAVWGLPDAYAGTNDCYSVYYVGDKEQWIEFKTEPPHCFMPIGWMPPAAKVVPERRTRKLSDLTITNGITYQQVTAVWGRPDDFTGSGVEYYVYHLENGQEVHFAFDYVPPYHAMIATFFDPKKGTRKNLF